jgi:hypothetical protein
MSRLVTSFSKMRQIIVLLTLLYVTPSIAGVPLTDGESRWVPARASLGRNDRENHVVKEALSTHTMLSGTGAICGELHLSLSQPVTVAMAGDEFDTGAKTKAATPSSSPKKSLMKAGLYSALLPGLGQRYVGSPTKTKVFLAVEIVTWLGYASYKVYEGWKEDDMIRFAAEHANAQLENTSDDFRDLVGFYDDIDQYNMVARATDFGTRPYLMDTPENHWRWQSPGEQSAYRQFKNRWHEAGRRAEIMLVMTVVNRFVSIIDAVRDARKSNRRLDTEFSKEEKPSVHLAIDPLSRNNQVTVAVTGLF